MKSTSIISLTLLSDKMLGCMIYAFLTSPATTYVKTAYLCVSCLTT